MIAGALLVLPGALAMLMGGISQALGIPLLHDAAFSSSIFVALATASLFVGAPLALLLNLTGATCSRPVFVKSDWFA